MKKMIFASLFLGGCASTPPQPSQFETAALSWIGAPITEMTAVWGPPTDHKEGNADLGVPAYVGWIDAKITEKKPAPQNPNPTYTTNCNSYGYNTNCTTQKRNDGSYQAGYALGQALASMGDYNCSVTAVVDAKTFLVADVTVEQKNRKGCDKRYSDRLPALHR